MSKRDKKIQDILDKIEEDNTSSNVDPVDTPYFIDPDDSDLDHYTSYTSIGYKKAMRNKNLRANINEIQEEWLESIQNISLEKTKKTNIKELFEKTLEQLNLIEKTLDKKLNESSRKKYEYLFSSLEKLTNRIGYHFTKGK